MNPIQPYNGLVAAPARAGRVLLINPPMDMLSGPPRFISFGIAYIAQKLKSAGVEVDLLDIDAYRLSQSEVSEFIAGRNFDIVGIGGLVTVYPYLTWLVPEIKKLKPDMEIILGGGIASSLKEKCFRRFDIDYEVIGEGENTIVELLQEIKGAKNLSSVKGIGFRYNGEIVFTEPRPLMASLDDIPVFDDSLFPMKRILENSQGIFQLHTQRGCPYSCTFCFNCFRVVSDKVRYRPVNDVIDEMERFNNKYQVRLFALAGELILANKKWIISFCKEILSRKLKIKYRVTSRVNTLDEERLDWLKKSGCVSMSLGLESGSDKILQIMKKRATVAQSKRAVLLAKRYIPHLELSMMLNHIGETKDTLKESVIFFKKLGIKPIIFYAVPFPGTELYDMALEKGRIKDEEAYLMNIDQTSILKPSLNLTDMPDDEADREMASAIKEINNYYLYKYLRSPAAYKRVFSKIKEFGFINTVERIFKEFNIIR